jgi:hypothetical protein
MVRHYYVDEYSPSPGVTFVVNAFLRTNVQRDSCEISLKESPILDVNAICIKKGSAVSIPFSCLLRRL